MLPQLRFYSIFKCLSPFYRLLQKKARSGAQRDAFLTSKTITHSTMFVSPLQSREKSFYCVWCLILWSENCTCPKIRQWFGKTNCFCHTINHSITSEILRDPSWHISSQSPVLSLQWHQPEFRDGQDINLAWRLFILYISGRIQVE